MGEPSTVLRHAGVALLGLVVVCEAAAQRSGGAPDLAEIWARGGCTGGQPCPFIPTQLPLKARAIGFIQAFDEALGPKYDCAPATMPSLVIDPYNFSIEQLRDRFLFTYEKDDIVRTIWLNGAGPQPTVYDQYWQGHSVGRYENGTLIVETTKFPFDPTGLDDMYNIPSSTQKRVIERYWREGDTLKAEIVTEDPLLLTRAIQFTFEWQKTDVPLVLPYDCDPGIAKQPLQFIPSKYQDPGLHRVARIAEHAAFAMTKRSRDERMTMALRWTTAFVCGLLLPMVPTVHAHHAQAPFFDQERTVEVSGTVVRWIFRNPHPVLEIAADNGQGQQVVWAVQFAPATVLAKRGWTDQTFKAGDAVVATGHPSRAPGTYGLEQQSLARTDGSPIVR